MHVHHYFHPNQVYLTLETLLKSKNRLQNIELPKSSYPNFPEFVDTTVFNKKSNNSLSIAWDVKSISSVVRRQEISKPVGNEDGIVSYESLYGSFSEYLQSFKDMNLVDLNKLPLTITLENSIDQTKKLQKILKQYIELFAEDELFGTGKDVSFEAHINIFREYLDKVLKVYNPKYLQISNNDLTELLKEKHSFINETNTDYKFIEMVAMLWFADIIDIYYLEIGYQNNKYNYNVTLALKNSNLISSDYIKERLHMAPSATSVVILPIDRSYMYENAQLMFRLSDGSTDQLDFSRADKSRMMFEAFWDLWKKDNSGEYTIKQICDSYKRVNKEDLEMVTKIGETVTNIRSTILEPKHRIKDNIEWRFDRKRGVWIFRINSKVNN